MNSVFMVGEQRSGSNLLRLILNESKEIAAPHPPHILQRLMPVVEGKDLSNEKVFRELIDHVCLLVEANPVQWDGVNFDREDIYKRCRENSLIAIFGAVMDVYAEMQNANTWLCKSLQNIRWAEQLDEYFNNNKYIYLYRDPRDVTLSFMKAVVGEKHPYYIAKQWTELQKLCMDHGSKLSDARFFAVCYEELIGEPEQMVRNLCEFLEVEYCESMLIFHESKEATRAASSSRLWENVTRPIMRSNSNKFLNEMSDLQIEIIESIAGNTMDKLGYERFRINRGYELNFKPSEIDGFKIENERNKRAVVKNTDPEDIRRRKNQDIVIQKIIEFSEGIKEEEMVA